MKKEEILAQLKLSIIEGEEENTIKLTKAAVEEGIDIRKILNDTIIVAAEEVGKLYEQKEYFLTELILGAEAMTSAMKILKPLLENSSVSSKGTILLGTVQGDLHNIGKDIVKSLLMGQGYDIVDLGVDVSPEKFVEAAKEYNPDIIGLSALLTVAISKLHETIMALKEADIPAKIIIGGGIVSEKTCERIGADSWSKEAYDGVKKINELIKNRGGA